MDDFLVEKDRIFDKLFELANKFDDKEPEEITDEQKEEVNALKELFVTKTKETWNIIMDHEITLVNQTEQVWSLPS